VILRLNSGSALSHWQADGTAHRPHMPNEVVPHSGWRRSFSAESRSAPARCR